MVTFMGSITIYCEHQHARVMFSLLKNLLVKLHQPKKVFAIAFVSFVIICT